MKAVSSGEAGEKKREESLKWDCKESREGEEEEKKEEKKEGKKTYIKRGKGGCEGKEDKDNGEKWQVVRLQVADVKCEW